MDPAADTNSVSINSLEADDESMTTLQIDGDHGPNETKEELLKKLRGALEHGALFAYDIDPLCPGLVEALSTLGPWTGMAGRGLARFLADDFEGDMSWLRDSADRRAT